MKNTNYLIAIELIKAQQASMSGKLDILTEDNQFRYEKITGYKMKEMHIINALRLISRTRSMFSYWVEFAPDQNGFSSVVAYFQFKLEGKRYQISFHTPYRKSSSELDSYIGKGTKMRWNKQRGGSIIAAEALLGAIDNKALT